MHLVGKEINKHTHKKHVHEQRLKKRKETEAMNFKENRGGTWEGLAGEKRTGK